MEMEYEDKSENKQKSTSLARMGYNAAIKTTYDLHRWSCDNNQDNFFKLKLHFFPVL